MVTSNGFGLSSNASVATFAAVAAATAGVAVVGYYLVKRESSYINPGAHDSSTGNAPSSASSVVAIIKDISGRLQAVAGGSFETILSLASTSGERLCNLRWIPARPNVQVIFVLGGPGVGKGTQCKKLVDNFGFVHLSAGDLLRAECKRQGSLYGELIETYIREGKIVPQEITIGLLRQAMLFDSWTMDSRCRRFLIDGFPRALDQAHMFERMVCPGSAVLTFTCDTEIMISRLKKRGQTSGRVDDNIETIKKRLATFQSETMPVIEHYKFAGKLIEIACDGDANHVFELVKTAILPLIK